LIFHNREVAGYLTPRSPTGAAFMLLSVFSDERHVIHAGVYFIDKKHD
jgi:hypothetical protein